MPDSFGEPKTKLSRRDFLKLAVGEAAYLAVRPYLRILNGLYQNSLNSDEFEDNINNAVNFIKDNYSVDVYTGMPKVENFFLPPEVNPFYCTSYQSMYS